MNELTRELMIKAISDVDSIDNPETQRMYIPDCFAERFAELLVNECATDMLKWRREPFPLDAESAARIIKQHFGVN